MSAIVLGRGVATWQYGRRPVVAARLNRRQWWPPAGGGEGDVLALANYDHGLWGPTDELTPAPQIPDGPMSLVETDVDQGKPVGGYVINPNPSGPIIRGRWKATDEPSTTFDGYAHPAGTGPALARPDSPNPAQTGWVWSVHVDGRGGHVWLDLASNPIARDMDFHLQVENCRTFRLTGAEWVCDDVRKISGGWPDNGGWLNLSDGGGQEQWIKFTGNSTIKDAVYFVEGCLLDLDHGGVVPSYRTDIFSSSYIDGPTNNNSVIVFQNCVLWGASSSLTAPASHADIFHMQGSSYWRYVIAENLRTRSNYQGFQNHYPTARPTVTTNETHFRWYRCRLWSADSGGETPQAIAFFGTGTNYNRFASFEMDDVVIARNGALIYQNVLSNGLAVPSGYQNARANIPRYLPYSGDPTQPGMSSLRNVQRIDHGTDPNLDGIVPRSAIGHSYRSLWNRYGQLLVH